MAARRRLLKKKTKSPEKGFPEVEPIDFVSRTLPSGLRVVVIPQPSRRAHVAAYLRVGSRYETPKSNGLSHFLEHMLYRGTPSLRTAHEVNLAFESLGGSLYAATHVDFGVFSVTLPPESLDEATHLFADVLSNPTFDNAEVEKGIVLEEILEDLDDEGRQVDADNLSRSLIYGDHPLGFTITGTEDRVSSFTRAMLRRHHARHYTTGNTVLAFSGRVDPKACFALAAKAFAKYPKGDPIDAKKPPPQQDAARVLVVPSASSQTEMRLSFRAVGENSKERAATDVLLRILDDGMSGRLYRRICDDQGLCYDISANFDGYEDDGVIDVAAGCTHERASRIAREALDLFRELKAEGPTDEELAKVKRRNAWEVRSMLDSPEDVASYFAGAWLFDRFSTPWSRLAENTAVTKEEIRDLLRVVATPERLSVLAVGMLKGKQKTELEAIAERFR